MGFRDFVSGMKLIYRRNLSEAMAIAPFSLLPLFAHFSFEESIWWESMLDSLSSPRFRVFIDLFLLLSLIFLASAALLLSRRFESLVSLLRKPLHSFSNGIRNGFCSEGLPCSCCSSKAKSCNDLPSKNGAKDVEGMQMEMGKLREEIARERQLREEAVEHLEEERQSARTAADEMMMKLMLLQKEKGLVEMEARQFRKIVEQKEAYDREIIEYLKWILARHAVEKRDMVIGIEASEQIGLRNLDHLDHIFQQMQQKPEGEVDKTDGLHEKGFRCIHQPERSQWVQVSNRPCTGKGNQVLLSQRI